VVRLRDAPTGMLWQAEPDLPAQTSKAGSTMNTAD
jgi:hypothetical protein